MQYYLSQLAKHIFENNKDGLSKLCIVFPNRRAGLFFQQYLAEKIDKPIWSPNIVTIKDFVYKNSELTQAENLKLLYELYKIYVKLKKSNESFDDFLPWGEIILRDFDELDKYMVDAGEIFKNIYDLKKLDKEYNYLTQEQIDAITEFWKSFSEKRSKNQENFIYIWELLNKLYAEYKNILLSKKIAYEGMIYRQVAEKIKANQFIEKDKYSKIIFVGFNAVNSAEEIFLNYYKAQGNTEFYWDYDNYYYKQEHHEAGQFLRKNIKKFSKVDIDADLNNFEKKKNIQIISCPSDLMQVNVLNGILSKLLAKSEASKVKFNETAVVLADENLLIPVLYSIPGSFSDVNVTMGYPLSNSSVYSLIEIFIDLSTNILNKNEKLFFNHIHIENILYHNYNKLFEGNAEVVLKSIKENNISSVGSKLLADLEIFKGVEKLALGATEMLNFILEKLVYIFQALDENTVDKEFVFAIHSELKKLQNIIVAENLSIKKETFSKLLRKVVQLVKVPFAGEPLSGIQILGILETRLLDFKNVIILSLNEGKFPPSSSANSFIPYNLRKGFGMPTIEYGDAMYSYYFYRLIQRAENISLLYNTDKSFESAGEMSRFLYQLQYESGLEISLKSLNYDIEVQTPKSITIQKNDYKEKLNRYLKGEKYLSPSSLNTYLDCSLKFFYKYILELNEPQEVSEELGHDVFGTILHDILQNLYSPFENKEITKELLQSWISNDDLISSEVLKSYQKSYSQDKPSGQDLIIVETIKKYVKQILRFDISRLPFKIIATEKSVYSEYNFGEKSVKVGGKIDRIDLKDNIIQLIDYKSGTVELETKKGIAGLFSEERNHRNNVAFQMLMYSYIYSKTDSLNYDVSPNVFPVRNLYKPDFNTMLKIDKQAVNKFKLYEQEFLENLNQLLNTIFDFESNFEQTEDLKNCEYCAYNKICHRDY